MAEYDALVQATHFQAQSAVIVEYLKFTAVWGAVVFFLTVAFHLVFFNPNKGKDKSEIKVLDKAVIQSRLDAMGKMSKSEIRCVVVLALVIILWLTESIHGISTGAVALGGWIVLFATGDTTHEDYSTKMMWSVYLQHCSCRPA